jgi:hypothetical protein
MYLSIDNSNLENEALFDNIHIEQDACNFDDIFSEIDQNGDGLISYLGKFIYLSILFLFIYLSIYLSILYLEFEDFINATNNTSN